MKVFTEIISMVFNNELENFKVETNKKSQDRDIQLTIEGVSIIVDVQQSLNFARYRDVRLDYISAYYPGTRRPSGSELLRAIDNGEIEVKKWGKLDETSVDIIAYLFTNGNKIAKIYSAKALQENKAYFLDEYVSDIKTNIKPSGEGWGSAFICVPIDDDKLKSCEINSINDLLRHGCRNK